jgi:hypothetical protein
MSYSIREIVTLLNKIYQYQAYKYANHGTTVMDGSQIDDFVGEEDKMINLVSSDRQPAV